MDWGGVKPSIIYSPEDNKIKICIETWGGWIRQEIVSSSEDEEDAGDNGKNDDVLVGRVHSGGLWKDHRHEIG